MLLLLSADRYCAAITGVLPEDPLKVAEAEQAYCFIADIWEVRLYVARALLASTTSTPLYAT